MPIKKQRPGTHADEDATRALDSGSESTAVLTSGNGRYEAKLLLAALKSLRVRAATAGRAPAARPAPAD